MAEFLPRLTSVSPRLIDSTSRDETYNQQIYDLIAFLKQPSSASAIAPVSDYLLDSLDPSIHSLSYLFVLNFHIQSIQRKTKNRLPGGILPGGGLWSKAVHFLRSFDAIQIRYAGLEWRQLVELVSQAAQADSKPLLAASVIRDSIIRLDSSEVFTSVHLLFIRLSILSKSYSYALPILDRQIYHLPNAMSQGYQKYHQPYLCADHECNTAFITDTSGFSSILTHRDHLQYFLYGAMVYIFLKKWDKALHWLGIVISSPVTNSVSRIMVEAYKKWLLASLLGYGKVLAPPPAISSHVMKVYQALARPYISIADAFEQGNFERLRAEIEMARSIWHTDNNTGLVLQLVPAFNKYMVLKLGKTFSALRISDVAQQKSTTHTASPKRVEATVASLIMSSTVSAMLVHAPAHVNSTMLRFAPSGKSCIFQECHVQTELTWERQLLGAIGHCINQGNLEMGFSNEHFQFMHRNQKVVDSSAINQRDETGRGNDADEDMMEDLY